MDNNKQKKKVIERNPPYVTVAVLESFFEKIQKINPPSERITSETINNWAIAGKQEHFLISALKFLGAIDNRGMPTGVFAKLQMTGEQFKNELSQIIKGAYSDFFDMYKSVETVTKDEIIAFFQQYSNASKVKMALVFSYLCDLAGMPNAGYSKTQKTLMAGKALKTTIEPKTKVIKKVIRKSQTTSPEGSEILRLAEAMKDWDPEKMKMFFNGMRETYGKKTDKQESDE